MINIGKFNTLKIAKQTDTAIFLNGENRGDIELNSNDIDPSFKAGDEINVFVYSDGKGKLLATTQTPLAQVDEVAWLKVVSLSHAGAFMNWGLPKDLLVPFSEQKQKMSEGFYYMVMLFLDDNDRIAASMLLEDFINDEAIYLKSGQAVDLIIADETELGYKAIINHKYWGVLYKNELFQKIQKGQSVKGFIKKVRDDMKIDLTLNQDTYGQKVQSVTDLILSRLKQQGGEMAITDKSPPQVIYNTFGVSKKVFKQALGKLYKQRIILIVENSIKLTEKKSN